VIDQAERLLHRHGRSGVLIDTNLLFVFVLGAVDRRQITSAKRASGFTEMDFGLLVAMVDRIERLIVTAYVATEVSNLATALGEYHRRKFLELFRALLTNQSTERHMPLRMVVELDEFNVLGATDTAIMRARTRPPLVVTGDWALAMKLEALGRPVINFNHIRGAALGVYSP
jgi:hypothetical protein